MFERENALRILTDEQEEVVHEQAMRILEEIGTDVLHDEARKLLERSRPQGRWRPRVLGPRFRDGTGREGTAVVPDARPEPRAIGHGGGGRHAALDERGRTAVRERPRRRTPQRADPGPRHPREAHAGHRRPELRADRRVRGDRPPDGEPPHGSGVLDDPVVGQAVHDLRDERSAGPGRDPDGRDRARRPRGDRDRARAPRHRESELTADLGLPHDGRADGVGRGEAADRGHAVPAGGGDERGERQRWPHAAGGRGPVRRRARAGRARGRAVPVRIVLHGHRHAHGLARVRHAGVRVRGARGLPDGAALRPSVPGRRRARVVAGRRRAGRGRDADDALGDDAGRDRRGAARGRLARGRALRQFREVRARRGAARAVPGADGRDRVHGGGARVRRAEGGRPGRALPVVAAHADALQGVALHEPAVPDPGLRDLGDERRRDHRGRREPVVEADPRFVRGPGARAGDRRGAHWRTSRAVATPRICSPRTEGPSRRGRARGCPRPPPRRRRGTCRAHPCGPRSGRTPRPRRTP